MKLLLKIAFDGERFSGYQAQPDARTVQGTLTEAFETVFGEMVNVTGCSRTDAGVHAEGFVVCVEPVKTRGEWLKIPPSKIHRACRRALPDDISVLGAFITEDDSFHPRYSVLKKEYIYRIDDSYAPTPFTRGRALRLGRPLDGGAIERMARAAERFRGEHDFSSFMAAHSKITDPVRHVFDTGVSRDGDGLVTFSVSADGFLYNMVRIMTGTLLDAADGKIAPEDIEGIIAARDRSRAGATVPACGLYLKEVTYPFKTEWVAD